MDSKTPLVKKLGIKIGDNIALINEPDHYDALIDDWPVGVSISRDLGEPSFDFIHYFCKSAAKLEADLPGLKAHLAKTGKLWVSWPKQAPSAKTDLSDSVVRELGLANRLVDTKVAAIDETWSGLKFVYRSNNR
jgi:hypothetical protein